MYTVHVHMHIYKYFEEISTEALKKLGWIHNSWHECCTAPLTQLTGSKFCDPLQPPSFPASAAPFELRVYELFLSSAFPHSKVKWQAIISTSASAMALSTDEGTRRPGGFGRPDKRFTSATNLAP